MVRRVQDDCLPVRVAPAPGEALDSFVRRVAAVNGVQPRWIGNLPFETGRPVRFRRPHIERIAVLTGMPAEALEQMVFRRSTSAVFAIKYPLGCARSSGLVHCPSCSQGGGVVKRDWSLAAVVACQDCGVFLRRGHPPYVEHWQHEVSPGLRAAVSAETGPGVAASRDVLAMQAELLHLVHTKPGDPSTNARLRAIVHGWQVVKGKPVPLRASPLIAAQRRLVSALLRDDERVTAAMPQLASLAAAADAPVRMTVNLLTRWQAAADPYSYEPRPQLPGIRTRHTALPPVRRRRIAGTPDPARDRLLAEIAALREQSGLETRHVPACAWLGKRPGITWPSVASARAVAPGECWTPRFRAAVLHCVIGADLDRRYWGSMRGAFADLANRNHGRVQTTVMTVSPANPREVEELLRAAAVLIDDGLIDYRHRRDQLSTVVMVDKAATRRLSAQARAYHDVRYLAAAWIWSELTSGPLSGGACQGISQRRLAGFDRALLPEDRLALVEHGLQLCGLTADLVDSAATPGTRAGAWSEPLTAGG